MYSLDPHVHPRAPAATVVELSQQAGSRDWLELDNTVYEAMMCRELLLLGRTELSCSALFSNDVSRETESRVDDADRDLPRCASSLNGESTSGRRCHSLP